jgi:hypothetical protein
LILTGLYILNVYFSVLPARPNNLASARQQEGDMPGEQSTLEDDVAAAFARACSEQDFVLAEYLLQALEAIANREGQEERLGIAFLHLVHAMPSCGH